MTRPSSGGFASAIARSFAASGGVVCTCTFFDGRFGFAVANEPEEIDRFKGSKYVKSDPTGIYHQVRDLLKTGDGSCSSGCPARCPQCATLSGSGWRSASIQPTSSARHAVAATSGDVPPEHGYELSDLKDIAFRRKARFQLRDGSATIDKPGVVDRYLIAFLEGLDYTENCYSCAYARRERVSDLTLGDSWGTELGDEADGRDFSCALPDGEG